MNRTGYYIIVVNGFRGNKLMFEVKYRNALSFIWSFDRRFRINENDRGTSLYGKFDI